MAPPCRCLTRSYRFIRRTPHRRSPPSPSPDGEGLFVAVKDPGGDMDTGSRPAARPAPPAGTKVTGAQALIHSLEVEGVQHVFGIPGGTILPAYDPLLESSIRHILCRHEQGASHAADGYAQASGKAGVCFA